MSASSTAIDPRTCPEERLSAARETDGALRLAPRRASPWRLYQSPTQERIAVETSASSENAPSPCLPQRRTTIAAPTGPRADPTLPPTWNSDCASPGRPPEAMRATRDDSG